MRASAVSSFERFVDRLAHELLDRRFAPRRERALPEAAAESLDAGDPDAVRLAVSPSSIVVPASLRIWRTSSALPDS